MSDLNQREGISVSKPRSEWSQRAESLGNKAYNTEPLSDAERAEIEQDPWLRLVIGAMGWKGQQDSKDRITDMINHAAAGD